MFSRRVVTGQVRNIKKLFNLQGCQVRTANGVCPYLLHPLSMLGVWLRSFAPGFLSKSSDISEAVGDAEHPHSFSESHGIPQNSTVGYGHCHRWFLSCRRHPEVHLGKPPSCHDTKLIFKQGVAIWKSIQFSQFPSAWYSRSQLP